MNKGELSQKEDFILPSMRLSENYQNALHQVEKMKAAVDFSSAQKIPDVENIIKQIMPTVAQMMKQIYNENTIYTQSNENEVLAGLRNNFQMAVILMDIPKQTLEHVMKFNSVPFVQIPSLPLNLAEILLITFEHCKNGQKTYQKNFKLVTEVLELFRKTQEVHTKFLKFLDNYLIFDLSNEYDMVVFKSLLDNIVKISEMLSGINTKSMADNWKGFIALIQKYSNILNTGSLSLSSPICSLSLEIQSGMQMILEMGSVDMKKSIQTLKVIGFLVKVAVKLFETYLDAFENCHSLFNFCVVVYSWNHGLLKSNNFPSEFIESVDDILFSNMDPFINEIFSKSTFMKKFCHLESNSKVLQQSFGFLNFTNEFLKKLPSLMQTQPHIVENADIVPLLYLIFGCTRNCYKEFFCDYNSNFYDELVTNISTVVLLFPDSYFQVEKLLLECVIQDMIWTSMIAIDIWFMILRYSSLSTCRSTLNALITKLRDLNLRISVEAPSVLFLKILIQKLFKILPNNVTSEEMSKYNPSQDLLVWKVINMKCVPLSQRFYVEFILSDLYDKTNIMEKENSSMDEIVLLMETLDILSYADFNDLEINTSRLIPLIIRLWSFNGGELTSGNNFYKHYIYKLTKITKAIINELNGENLLLVLNQLKQLLSETLFIKLLFCDVIEGISKRNFSNCQEKFTLLAVISDVFQILLNDKNPVVIQVTLEAFEKISKNENYETVVNKVLTSSPVIKKRVVNFMQQSAVKTNYSVTYFEKIHNLKFQHRCLEWTESEQPQCKKIKIESDIDDSIETLKNDTQKLIKIMNRTRLTSRQMADVKGVINKLETLLI